MEVLEGGLSQAELEVEAKAREIQKLLGQAGIDSVVNPVDSYAGELIGKPLKYSGADAPAWADSVTVYRDKAREWRWRRVGGNGEIVGASHEGFKNFTDCQANLNRSFFSVSIRDVVIED